MNKKAVLKTRECQLLPEGQDYLPMVSKFNKNQASPAFIMVEIDIEPQIRPK
jgi:hypothetical protein